MFATMIYLAIILAVRFYVFRKKPQKAEKLFEKFMVGFIVGHLVVSEGLPLLVNLIH